MKCPECDGYKNFVSLAGTPFEVVRPCKRCNGTGEVQMTNEEWFCGLSTEEKAKWFCDHITCSDGCRFYGNCFGEQEGRELWQEWLKQPHQSVTNCNE